MTIPQDGVDYVFYFLFVSILRNVKILYLDIYELLMVNYVPVTEKIYVFKLEYNIKTWLKILKN